MWSNYQKIPDLQEQHRFFFRRYSLCYSNIHFDSVIGFQYKYFIWISEYSSYLILKTIFRSKQISTKEQSISNNFVHLRHIDTTKRYHTNIELFVAILLCNDWVGEEEHECTGKILKLENIHAIKELQMFKYVDFQKWICSKSNELE